MADAHVPAPLPALRWVYYGSRQFRLRATRPLDATGWQFCPALPGLDHIPLTTTPLPLHSAQLQPALHFTLLACALPRLQHCH